MSHSPEGILRERAWGGQSLADPHACDAPREGFPVDPVSITEQIPGAVSFGSASTSCWAVQAAVG